MKAFNVEFEKEGSYREILVIAEDMETVSAEYPDATTIRERTTQVVVLKKKPKEEESTAATSEVYGGIFD